MASKVQMPEIKAKSIKTEEPGGKWFDIVSALKSAAENITEILARIEAIEESIGTIEERIDTIEEEVFPEPDPEPDDNPENK